jgi:type IV pilus assembly protein PilV
MLEVLVTLTIVAFGVLGLLGLQARALTFQKDSFDRRSAAELVAQMGERMRANHIAFTSGLYAAAPNPLQDTTPTPAAITPCAVPTDCTVAEVANRDLEQWYVELRRRVPGAAAYVEWNPANPLAARVSIAWPEPQATVPDPVCTALNGRVGAFLPVSYRCYDAYINP